MHGHPLVATTVTTATVYPHAPALHVAVHYVDIIISSSLNVNPKRCTMEFGFFLVFFRKACARLMTNEPQIIQRGVENARVSTVSLFPGLLLSP